MNMKQELNQELNKARLLATILIGSMLLAIPFFLAIRTEVVMYEWGDVVLYCLSSLFLGGLNTCLIIWLLIFAMNNTLPKWFWESN